MLLTTYYATYYATYDATCYVQVVFFNQTQRSRAVLRAWAEAMAWPANQRAPDDQVK